MQLRNSVAMLPALALPASPFQTHLNAKAASENSHLPHGTGIRNVSGPCCASCNRCIAKVHHNVGSGEGMVKS
ncbi:hypothetical protein ZHAS_00020217 [Anopheles sinensis]|uniref:Uncharacterized protein n=1 Tax=Anopheles sinensis TaxID=74873 RepID=A0A084WP91_ANOSI|nr:hypothetical protein ZHAS_00020217 [Anopheles sinensis]